MNGAKPSERAKIARKLAEEVLAMTVYDIVTVKPEIKKQTLFMLLFRLKK